MWKRMKEQQVAARKGHINEQPVAANTELENSGSQ